MTSNGDGDHHAEDELDRLHAVTDTSLARLDVEELLDELLDRSLELLDADTAAVLLLDETSNELVATAARGIEEEVRQGVRVPVGHGFAGRIAHEATPVVLPRVGPGVVWNPLLWEKGITSMLGVPLLSAGRVLGVLHVGTLEPRDFTDEDIRVLELAAERVAGAAQTRLDRAQRAAAQVLQRSLLPAELPRHDVLEFAARYVPAEQGVGGDWYDVFVLSSGEVWMVVGDVAGHGLKAAVVMGRLRTSVRAHALGGSSPDRALASADKVLQHFDPGAMATVAVAMWAPPFEEVQVASAGHLPPVLATPGGEPVLLALDTAPPVGSGTHDLIATTRVPVPPGGVLVFYTDGLVERRGEMIDEGLARLTAAVGVEAPDEVCHRVMRSLIGSEATTDDVALLAVRRRGA